MTPARPADPASPAPRVDLGAARPRGWQAVGAWLFVAACAHPAGTTPPAAASAAWIDLPLLGSPATEVDVLAGLAAGDARARGVRLDRLLDLYDAARFGQDEGARETLWAALGGHATGVGERASREASERMLQAALALDEAARRAADDDTARLAADAITMLSADLQPPATADDLSIRTLVHRTLALQGHPRLRDNARWRLYDHARGTLQAAVELPPDERLGVAVQALYAERDSVEQLLADTAPQARPPWPTADGLWALVQAQATALRQWPRWAAVVERRQGDDDALHDTLRASLPAARSDEWPLPSLPSGTARAESLAPVAWIHEGRLTVDAGRPYARTIALEAEATAEREATVVQLAQALGNALAQDGRGTLLLVAEPRLPAPQLHAALRAVFRAHAERLELAVAEPRVDPDAGRVVMALPLHVTHSAGQRAGDRAWAQVRVHVHLDGRGPSAAIDGHWLAEAPADARGLRALVERIARAYPRERGVVLTVGTDVQLQQLLDVVVALQGGPERPFSAVGWMADGARPAARRTDGDARLARRLALAWPVPRMELEQPYSLEAHDQARLEGFAKGIAVCLPELEPERAPTDVALALRFSEGRLREASLPAARRLPKAGVAAVIECVRDEGYALRLRSHREAVDLVVTLRAPEPPGA